MDLTQANLLYAALQQKIDRTEKRIENLQKFEKGFTRDSMYTYALLANDMSLPEDERMVHKQMFEDIVERDRQQSKSWHTNIETNKLEIENELPSKVEEVEVEEEIENVDSKEECEARLGDFSC